jgi:hypothetical protein
VIVHQAQGAGRERDVPGLVPLGQREHLFPVDHPHLPNDVQHAGGPVEVVGRDPEQLPLPQPAPMTMQIR